MKKLIFTLAIVLAAATVSAQESGKMWVGGSVGFSSSKTKGSDAQTSYKILPEFGYFIQDNLAIAVSVGYKHLEGAQLKDLTNANLDAAVDGELEGFTIAPFVRYTFLKGNVGGLFIDGGVGYSHLKEKTADIKYNMFDIGFRPGVAINVTDNLAVTGKFGFLGYQYTKAGHAKTNSFGLDFDMTQFLVGVSYVF